MTDSQGRDGAPSVAALAVHLNTLRTEVEALAVKADALASTQHQHTVLLDGITGLRRQVEQILTTLTEQEDGRPATWFWLTMDDQERDEKLSEVSDWVETVLRAEYPSYLDGHLRPCWPNHPEARWELACLYQLWTAAYLAKRPSPRDAADWHDRWLPGAVNRLGRVMAACSRECKRQPVSG